MIETPPPRGREDLALVRGGRSGVWWQAPDGLTVRLAAPEREPAAERSRLATLAMLLALFASSRARQ
jgi:hypothetical protein